MKTSLVISFIIMLTLAVLPVNGAINSNDKLCQKAVGKRLFWKRSDLSDLSEFPRWVRLEYFFRHTSNRSLEKLFTQIGPAQLTSYSVQNQDYRKSKDPVAAQLIADLNWLFRLDSSVMWAPRKKEDKTTFQERLLRALEAAKTRDLEKSDGESAFGGKPKASFEALRTTEKVLLEAAVSGSPKQGNTLGRWLVPLYGPVLSIIEFDNYVLREAKVVGDVDKVIADFLEGSTSLGLTAVEQKKLQLTLDDTPGQLANMQVLIAKAFGIQVARGQSLVSSDIDVYRVAKGVSNSDFESARVDSNLTALGDLNRLDEILEGRGPEVFALSAIKEIPLESRQTRWAVRDWANFHLNEKYQMTLNRTPGVSYKDEWTETEAKWEGSGNDRRLVYERVEHSSYRYPSYEDILNDDFYVRGTATGLETIRNDARSFRQKELHFKVPIIQAHDLLNSISTQIHEQKIPTQELKAFLPELGEKIASLKALRSDLQNYRNWPDELIKAQWSDDQVDDFRARNSALLDVLVNVLRLSSTVEFMISNNDSFLRDYQLPDRTKELAELRERWKKARISQAVLVGSAVTYGIAGMAYPPVFEVTMEYLDPVMSPVIDAIQPYATSLTEVAMAGYDSALEAFKNGYQTTSEYGEKLLTLITGK